jgi:tetratricopeptide (TPR) repeat protein
MMKRLLILLVLCCLASLAVAQEEMRVVDSLRECLAHQEGTAKVVTMAELSRALYDFSFEDCISFGEAAVQEAKNLSDDDLTVWALVKLGKRYMDHYDFDLSHDCFEQAVSIINNQEGGVGPEILDLLNNRGRVELLMGDLEKALSTFTLALEVSELFEDKMNCADVINNMAYIYYQQDDIDKAMECFNDACQRYEQLQDTISVAQCENNISNIFVQRQQYDEAKSLLLKAIPVFEKYGDDASLAHAYQNLGTVYATGLVNLDSALVYLRKSIICAENVDDQITLIEDEIELANVLKSLNRENEAIRLYQSALHSSEVMGYANGMMEAYKNIGIYYNETGDFTTSAVYLKRCMDLASEKGNYLYVNTVRPYLIADYARLGQLMEMKKELGLMNENYIGIINENNALSEELSSVLNETADLLADHDSQNNQIQTLQNERNHYRLAFFGLLAIVLFVVVLLIAYKIVRKNRSKSVKP